MLRGDSIGSEIIYAQWLSNGLNEVYENRGPSFSLNFKKDSMSSCLKFLQGDGDFRRKISPHVRWP